MERWEYKVVMEQGTSSQELVYIMNQLGEEGWELVSFSFGNLFDEDIQENIQRNAMIFKRHKP